MLTAGTKTGGMSARTVFISLSTDRARLIIRKRGKKMIEEVQCISARCGDEYKILLIRVSNMRPIAGLRLQTELWESDNMAIDIIKDECKECGIYDYHVEFYDIDNEITWTNLGGKKKKVRLRYER